MSGLSAAETRMMYERDAHQLHVSMIGMKRSRLSTEIQFAEIWSMEDLRHAADVLAYVLDIPVFRSRSKVRLASWVNRHAHAWHDKCMDEVKSELREC